jgi:hypothetical protein
MIAIVCLVLSVGAYVARYFVLKSMADLSKTSEDQCPTVGGAEGSDCLTWDGSSLCRKGKVTGGMCVAPGSYSPMVLFISGIVLGVAAIVFGVMAYRGRHSQ